VALLTPFTRERQVLAWIDRHQCRFIDILHDRGGTKARTEQLMATLKQRGTAFFAAKERDGNTRRSPVESANFPVH